MPLLVTDDDSAAAEDEKRTLDAPVTGTHHRAKLGAEQVALTTG